MACCCALGDDVVGKPGVAHDPLGEDADVPCRRDDSSAPVSEAVAVSGQRHRGIGAHVIRDHDVGGARVVRVEHEDHRHRLRARIDHVVSDADLHCSTPRRPRLPSSSAMTTQRCLQRCDDRCAKIAPRSAALQHERLVELDLDADVARRRKSPPQGPGESVPLPGIRIVASHAQARRLFGERVLPQLGEQRLARSRGIVQEADVGGSTVSVQHGRKTVRGEVDDPSSRRYCLFDNPRDLGR